MSTIYSVPRDKRYGKYKKVLYLEPPSDGAVTVKRRITTIIPPSRLPPAPAPPAPITATPSVVSRHRTASTIVDAVPPPPPRAPLPEREVEPDSPIDIIAVDVDPSESGSTKSSRSSKSHRSSHSSRSYDRSRNRDVYIERERVVPIRVAVPYPVAEPQYDTYRYVEAPRGYERYEPRRRSPDREVLIDDHHRRRVFRA
ncbi:hypothetical protein F4861DRAFT_254992 [Xylaria intraflava]|nr:hypothetical protein F4861DRAFT_254992 [Xylaria intraflava]